jgi:hypothetical protein
MVFSAIYGNPYGWNGCKLGYAMNDVDGVPHAQGPKSNSNIPRAEESSTILKLLSD